MSWLCSGPFQTQRTGVAAPAATQDIQNDTSPTEQAALAHLLFPSAFLALGALLSALSLLTLRFPDLLAGPFSPGRVKGMAAVALVVGWLIPAGSGIIYYLLPRLTGSPLAGAELARVAGPLSSLLALGGIAVVALGLGDGLAPLLLPWWMDLGVLAIATIPLLVTIQTLRNRTEEGVYVSVWFLAAAAVWLPLLYISTNLPGFFSVGRALQETSFLAGFVNAWILAVGVGAAFYVAAKTSGNPLSNRQLAKVAFWSLAFASIWAGPGRLALGATPDWLDTMAAVLGLALPIAMLAAAAGIVTTIDGAWSRLGEEPALQAIVSALGLATLLSILQSAATFRSAAGTLGFTVFWEGIDYGWTLGVGTLLFAGAIYQALPALAGRRMGDIGFARRGIRLTLIGSVGLVLSTLLAGLMTGFAWNGASFTSGSFGGAFEAWSEGLGPASGLFGLAVLFGTVALAGHIFIALSIVRTITSGRAVEQEVLVMEDSE